MFVSRSLCRALMLSLAVILAFSSHVVADSPKDLDKEDLRSFAREVADEARGGLEAEDVADSASNDAFEQGDERGPQNVQVNDPALDHIQSFAGERPFEFATQSETTIAVSGDNILVGYNTSADQPVVQDPATGRLRFVHRHLSGYSISHNRGGTWTSHFLPPVAGSVFTFGDPSVGVDRVGNFYYATLGRTSDNQHDALILGKSTDGGDTFGPAVVAAIDDGSDKEWLAVGPDPSQRDRDNLYIAWTSFQPPDAPTRTELRLARSTDGGATWTSKVIFAPTDGGPRGLAAAIQFANPVVDSSTGRLYVPFLHFSNFDADFIKVLVSDDAGETFRFLQFNVPGAPDPFGFPNVTPGTRSDCGTGGGRRLVLHQGPNLGGGRSGLPRFRNSTRLITQPTAAAAEGKVFIAFNSSTSPISGDPASQSEIRLLFSPNGGDSWVGPTTVAAASAADPQHVHPSLSIDNSGDRVAVAYYVQQADGRIRVEMAGGDVNNQRVGFERGKVQVSSVAFNLTPSNNPIPTTTNPFLTTNYDRSIRPCYDLGEYLATTIQGGEALVTWGDDRNPWTSPSGSPAAGTHSQEDVFFLRIND